MLSQYKFITPEMLNANGTLFGGSIMKWMDEVAYIAATKITLQKMVTFSANVKFINPITPFCFIEITADLAKCGNASLDMIVEVYAENMHSKERCLSASAIFKFAAIGADHKPCRITKLI